MPNWIYGSDVPNTTAAPLNSEHFRTRKGERHQLRELAAQIQLWSSWRRP